MQIFFTLLDLWGLVELVQEIKSKIIETGCEILDFFLTLYDINSKLEDILPNISKEDIDGFNKFALILANGDIEKAFDFMSDTKDLAFLLQNSGASDVEALTNAMTLVDRINKLSGNTGKDYDEVYDVIEDMLLGNENSRAELYYQIELDNVNKLLEGGNWEYVVDMILYQTMYAETGTPNIFYQIGFPELETTFYDPRENPNYVWSLRNLDNIGTSTQYQDSSEGNPGVQGTSPDQISSLSSLIELFSNPALTGGIQAFVAGLSQVSNFLSTISATCTVLIQQMSLLSSFLMTGLNIFMAGLAQMSNVLSTIIGVCTVFIGLMALLAPVLSINATILTLLALAFSTVIGVCTVFIGQMALLVPLLTINVAALTELALTLSIVSGICTVLIGQMALFTPLLTINTATLTVFALTLSTVIGISTVFIGQMALLVPLLTMNAATLAVLTLAFSGFATSILLANILIVTFGSNLSNLSILMTNTGNIFTAVSADMNKSLASIAETAGIVFAKILADFQVFTSGIVIGIASLIAAVKDLLQINSPSLVFAEIGGSIMEGMAKGIEDLSDIPVSATMKATSEITAASGIAVPQSSYESSGGGNQQVVFPSARDIGRAVAESMMQLGLAQ